MSERDRERERERERERGREKEREGERKREREMTLLLPGYNSCKQQNHWGRIFYLTKKKAFKKYLPGTISYHTSKTSSESYQPHLHLIQYWVPQKCFNVSYKVSQKWFVLVCCIEIKCTFLDKWNFFWNTPYILCFILFTSDTNNSLNRAQLHNPYKTIQLK